MLQQLHIIDISASNPILKQVFLTNTLVNPQSKKDSFFKINLFFKYQKYQNGEFKRFCSDQGFSLQETDQMFRLHTLLVDALAKIRHIMNKVLIRRERKGQHLIKSSFFDILSLSDQLYRSRSTVPKGPCQRHIYFSKNPMPDFIVERIRNLTIAVSLFNESISKNHVPSS